MSKVVGIIPSRYGSSRFPGKALADIAGKSMIRRVYEKASEALEEVIVATDDQRIFDHVQEFGKAVMTSESHRSGTDRCGEVVESLGHEVEYVINVQGDEPFIDPHEVMRVKQILEDSEGTIQIATLACPFPMESDPENPNIVKVVFDRSHRALYFSRSPIPFDRNGEAYYYQHIGLYAYRVDILQELSKLKQSTLEVSESLEQLRWLENGYEIKVIESKGSLPGIDTPEDLEEALKFMAG